MPSMNVLKCQLWALLALAATTSSYSWAQGTPVVNQRSEKVDATITAIDPATRGLTLQGPKGPVNITAGPAVKNFDKLAVGDRVIVTYYEGIAARMAKPGSKIASAGGGTFSTPALGGAPGGLKGGSVTSTVEIQAIDPGTNTVAFKRADGTTHIVEAKAPQMQEFIRTLKPGDHVDVTYTESVAVNVIPDTSGASKSAESEAPAQPR